MAGWGWRTFGDLLYNTHTHAHPLPGARGLDAVTLYLPLLLVTQGVPTEPASPLRERQLFIDGSNNISGETLYLGRRQRQQTVRPRSLSLGHLHKK